MSPKKMLENKEIKIDKDLIDVGEKEGKIEGKIREKEGKIEREKERK